MIKGKSPNTSCYKYFYYRRFRFYDSNPDLSGVSLVKPHLALAEGALGAMFNPGGAAEA